jgi:hypothetical protein
MPRWRDYQEPGDVPAVDRPEPEPDVPHALGVIFGAQVGWDPGREGQRPGRRGECNDAISPGSRLVCAGCLASGFDDEVRAFLAVTPPKPRPRPCVARPRPAREGGRRRRGPG